MMTMMTYSASAQCPVGQTQVTITMGDAVFTGENGWMLWDATAGTTVAGVNSNQFGGTAVPCAVSTPGGGWVDNGTVDACVTDGNTIELYGYESFGDAWTGDASVSVESTEDGSANGCDQQNFQFITLAVSGALDNDLTAGFGDGGIDCTMPDAGTNQVGDFMGSFSTVCVGCALECPDDITAGTDPGVCEAVVTIPDPILGNPDCVIIPSAGDFVSAQGAATPLNYNAAGLIVTPFTIPGVVQVPASATCVSEVCIDVEVVGDFGFATEMPEVTAEGVSLGFIIPVQAPDCQASTTTFCIPVGTFNAFAADGVINMQLEDDPDVDNFCNPATVQGTVDIPTSCVDFLNSVTGLANGPATYPVGTTCVNITGTGSGQGMDFPINCEVKVTVEDTEPPVLTCPGDFTFNLQGGECEQIYDYEVLVSDNCPTGEQEITGTFGSIGNCPGQGSTLSCGGFQTSQVQEFDISGFPTGADVQINEGCFIFDNTAWGQTMATVNFYEAPAGAQAAQSPMPCILTATPVATSGLVDVTMFATNPGEEACIPVFTPSGDPYLVTDAAPGLYMEVVTTGGAVSWNGPMCNGITSDGTNTYLCSVQCGSGYFADFGFNAIDAFFSFTGEVVAPEPPMMPGLNEFASGEALPIGVHCFEFSAIDFAGNTASCDWCVTINEFPSDQVVTSLACNDLVNVSLNEDCEAFISADMFLEGGPYGCYFNGYEVYIEGYTGDQNGATLALEPGTYTVTVNDVIRDNNCWGEMVVEDKLPPEFAVEDLTVTCKEDIPDFIEVATDISGVIAIPEMAGEEITSAEPAQTLEFVVDGEDCLISDVNVAFDITHTWIGDIELTVISPAGTSVMVQDNVCNLMDDQNVVYDDEGAPFSCALITPGTGAAVVPLNPLSAFDGEPISGTWSIRWDDTVGGDQGVFNAVSIIFNDGAIQCGNNVTADQYLAANGSACNIVDLSVAQEESIGDDCDGGIVLRTWVATDAAGNTSSQVQTITRERIGVDAVGTEWFWPANIVTMTCGAETTPDAIYAYFRAQWEAANPCPLPTCDPNDGHNYDAGFVADWECFANAAGVRWAYPLCFNDKGVQTSFLNNSCNVFFTYSDQFLAACGGPGNDCDGNSKVIRTWTALDWCTGATENAVQVIHAKDNEGPSASPLAPMTVSANPWGCAASFRFPVPDHLSDNCSSEVTYRIYGKPGTVAELEAGPRVMLDSDDNPVLDENGYPIWIVEGLPKAMGAYTYTYELSDCCGNVSYIELQVTVVDGAAPVAIAKQNIVISLTSSPTDPSGGSAKLYVESVDNGSHDGDCGPVRIAIRRTDAEDDPEDNVGYCGSLGDDHNNNASFFNFNNLPNSSQPNGHDRDDTDEGRYVKFCCQDLLDGEGEDTDGDGINDYVLIDVELGVWDDANMDGVPGTVGDLFGITWATVRVEAKLAPSITCPPLTKITCDMDEKNLALTGGAAYASSTCGNLDVVYEDLCGLDINQDGEISKFTVTNPNGMTINEVGMCTDVNRDGVIANYVAPWWSEVDEDLFNKACHYGPITRWWSIDGTDIKCRQLIIVEQPLSLQRFDGSVSIDWPYSEDEFIRLADNDGDDCGLMEVSGSDITQVDNNDDDIPEYAEVRLSCVDGLCDEPVWVDATCSLVGWSLDSDTFFFEGDACRKIINTYTVIDWCQYEPNAVVNAGAGSCSGNVDIDNLANGMDYTITVQSNGDVDVTVTVVDNPVGLVGFLGGPGNPISFPNGSGTFTYNLTGQTNPYVLDMYFNWANGGQGSSETVTCAASTAPAGIWTWTVIGKLIDTYAPVVESGDDMFPAVPGSGGSGTTIDERACVGTGITMSATAFDTNVDADGNVIENACPSEWLKWNVYVDINNDWVFDREWSSFVAEDRNTSTDPLWSEDNLTDNLAVYGYPIPDVRVGNRGGVDNNEGDFATAPGFEYTINIPDAIPADCGETTHRVVWKVYDGCGNVSSTTSYFTVQDKKAPTPYCINLSTALMADPDGAGPEESMVELWACDFDAGSFDNCVAYEDLRFTFSDVAPELDPNYDPALRCSSRRFTCDDLQGSSDATIEVGVYVWDLCGNYDWCVVNLRLVDNNPDGCTGGGTGSIIAGTVATEFGEVVENVEVSNMEMINEQELKDMTNAGEYAFYDNLKAMDYQLTADKDEDYLNGVSTLDLVLIQRHILGLASLDSPYKVIAADVNNDGAVTAIDLIELRKLILGIYDELPNNSSWRFADAATTIDINNPWNFKESIDIYNLSADMMDSDFIGIKIGDVNQSVVANINSGSTESRSSATININFEDVQVEAGQTVDLTITGDNFNNIFGYQFTLEAQSLELISVQSGAVNVTEENFGRVGNAVTTSWNSETALNATGDLFTMTFKSNTSGKLSDIINVSSAVTQAEAYVGTNLDIVNIALNNSAAADVEFALYQNEPNPFTANTAIGFNMPQAADAKLSILDVTGKVVKTISGNYAKGYNEIELSKSDLGAAGVYYYQLDSGDFTATKKMIIIE